MYTGIYLFIYPLNYLSIHSAPGGAPRQAPQGLRGLRGGGAGPTIMLYCAMLCYVMLCYAMLCYIIS